MFLDTAKIKVKAGNGGDGMVVVENTSLMVKLWAVMEDVVNSLLVDEGL